MQMTAGTNTPETLSAIFAIGAFVAAASLTMRMIWESVVSSPTRVASQRRKPDWFTRRGGNSVAHGLIHRNALAGQRGLVDGAGAFQDDAVHGDILTGAHDKHIAACAPRTMGTVTSLTIPDEHGAVFGASFMRPFKASVVLALGARLQHFADRDER